MPWIILHANGEELTRHDLVGPIVIGRSPECDIAIKDIMLSRTHCRIEPEGNAGWRLVDLGSRNGTRVGWDEVRVHGLRDGDHVRMGRTRMIYFAGAFVAPEHGRRHPDPDRIVRPADPHEALSGTVTDFVFVEEEHDEGAPKPSPDDDRFPSPQPRPADPESYGSPAVEALINDLASSVWERDRTEYPPSSSALEESAAGNAPAITTTNNEDGAQTALLAPRTRVRVRALPRIPRAAGAMTIYHQVPARLTSAETDLSLQVDASALIDVELVRQTPVDARRRFLHGAAMVLAAALGTLLMFMSLWLLTLAPP
jgi:predicted component of type VI protein secretion system